jgi:hypothetical protein
MTEEQARQLRPGDRVQTVVDGIRGVSLKVTRVNIGGDTLMIEVMDDEGREGIVQGAILEAIERLPGAEPLWWSELMEHDGPRD